ncbi:hypothetical protein [Daejeonella sp.]|uniref:hypothetical protein n=1 Tax=Daejeonella sp. TaxID=2805397 RepID=UPI0030C3AD7C
METTTESLDPKWEKAVKQCKKFRDEIRSYPIPKNKMTISYLFTQEDLDILLNQGGAKLNGIRAYIGFEEISGKLLPRLHVVGCVKDGTRYNDVVPSQIATNSQFLGDSLEEGRPCPEDCGTENELNN